MKILLSFLSILSICLGISWPQYSTDEIFKRQLDEWGLQITELKNHMLYDFDELASY